MNAIINFSLSFFFSFTGSIPPGTINLSSVQLGLEQKANIAWRLALAAAIMEYFYAFLAVKFESLITSAPLVVKNFHLIAAIVMLTLGALNLRSASRPSDFSLKFQNSGFRRGLLLGILNPLALPFWIGVTAYLKSQHWIDISTGFRLHSYLFGVSLGVFTLLVSVAYLAKKVIVLFKQSTFIKKIPGLVMLALGSYALIRYLIMINK
jgi:threonine/homoserine/homoserine lactone efflux protein